MKIKDKIKYYKESLDCFDDTMEKYKFLLDQGKKSQLFPEEFRKDSFKVQGCQAQVWLVPYIKNNLIYFYSDSDAFISKGMVTILCDIYGGRSPNEINNTNLNLLEDLELNVLLTPGRRNGVYSMLLKIKEHAKSHIK
jgi:cysteine desulfuration protein SufE